MYIVQYRRFCLSYFWGGESWRRPEVADPSSTYTPAAWSVRLPVSNLLQVCHCACRRRSYVRPWTCHSIGALKQFRVSVKPFADDYLYFSCNEHLRCPAAAMCSRLVEPVVIVSGRPYRLQIMLLFSGINTVKCLTMSAAVKLALCPQSIHQLLTCTFFYSI